MKKLSLNKMKLEVGDMLQREQLKTVFGGYDMFGDSLNSGCVTKGNGCNSSSPKNPRNLCCPGLKCDVKGHVDIGICIDA